MVINAMKLAIKSIVISLTGVQQVSLLFPKGEKVIQPRRGQAAFQKKKIGT
jgi:hypothetical protein